MYARPLLVRMPRTAGEYRAGCLKRLSGKAAAEENTGGIASGYVEDAFEARTMLAGFFSILPLLDDPS